MKFPLYIPEPIKQQATHYLDGSDSWHGYRTSLKEKKEKLSEINERITYWKLPVQDADYAEHRLEELRTEKIECEQRIEELDRDINSISRLIYDGSMKEVYRLLINEFHGDESADRKIDQFIFFAWSANINYAKPREAMTEARVLSKEISATATKLAKLLNKITETGCNCPDEFFSIASLLENTDNSGNNLYIWRSVRKYILGGPPAIEPRQVDDTAPVLRFIVNLNPEESPPQIAPQEQQRKTLRYGWEKAPYLPEILNTVAKAADEFKPSCGYFADAAIVSRQKSHKTEYIRGYVNLLCNGGINLSTDIVKAIAITATVVINSPDLIVTYDDVRKAIGLTS
jgi:hypothetical protein